ncbi:hypothetical protein [Rubinisphaera margarita]|uniref:hypothetical protein n=1 Tax=Rubinisphaera margarita TaxID=2909586 RepID=UPI001EE92C90|nr:hypothetical protein [Rubinisphaera margarita]MCG6155621.1 hypothetical protein [Rubinisphaera margarita]
MTKYDDESHLVRRTEYLEWLGKFFVGEEWDILCHLILFLLGEEIALSKEEIISELHEMALRCGSDLDIPFQVYVGRFSCEEKDVWRMRCDLLEQKGLIGPPTAFAISFAKGLRKWDQSRMLGSDEELLEKCQSEGVLSLTAEGFKMLCVLDTYTSAHAEGCSEVDEDDHHVATNTSRTDAMLQANPRLASELLGQLSAAYNPDELPTLLGSGRISWCRLREQYWQVHGAGKRNKESG